MIDFSVKMTLVLLLALLLALPACGTIRPATSAAGPPATTAPAAPPTQTAPPAVARVVVGAERLAQYLPRLQGQRVGLVINQTSRVGNAYLVDTLRARGVNVTAIFAPEHGFRGEAADGATITDGRDARSGVPVRSVYGKTKKPTPEIPARSGRAASAPAQLPFARGGLAIPEKTAQS